ncbi:MAG: glycosyltransferase family 4 protein [Deltaproteobacteria bacterium]|nr:glycosyltransferase family 4 protein [Candidatus Deferrimicrobium borealis]
MNILVINYEYPPIGGGGGVLCKDISEGIAAKGHRITVVTSHYGSLRKSENLHGVDIFRVPVLMRKKQTVASMASMISFVPMCIRKVKELMKCNSYDLINTQFAIPSGPAGQYISRKYNIPNVLTILGGDIIDPSKFLSPHNTFLLNQTVRKMLFGADRVVAESTDIKRNAQKYYGFDRQVDIVPPGIYPNTHPEMSRHALGLPADKFLFVTIGRLVKRKNLEDLLHVFQDVQKTTPSILLIIGDGPEKENLENLAKQLGIAGEIRILGRVSDAEKFQYLGVSDMYLSTAIHEGFGIVFLEAMECGLPVISYDRGGQTDFLREGKTGYLVGLGNRKNFELKIKELLNSNPLRTEIGAHNKNYVKAFYIEHIADRYISIFNEVVSTRKS